MIVPVIHLLNTFTIPSDNYSLFSAHPFPEIGPKVFSP